jgi:hypothetical protein
MRDLWRERRRTLRGCPNKRAAALAAKQRADARCEQTKSCHRRAVAVDCVNRLPIGQAHRMRGVCIVCKAAGTVFGNRNKGAGAGIHDYSCSNDSR